MQYSLLFPKSLRSSPQGLKTESNRLLLRGGYIRPLSQGLFSYLPLGLRVISNIEKIINREMEQLSGQEVQMPLVNPFDLWKKTKRDVMVNRDLVQFRDRHGHDVVLAPTHEEAAVELVRIGLNSYRDLPLFVYQYQSKFRDEEKPRYGLLRTKEFLMKDGYSFHRSYADLNNFFPKVFSAYQRIFKACSVNVIPAEAGTGYMGGEKSYEFLMPCDYGDDGIIICDSCGYTANREIAKGLKDYGSGSPKELDRVETPGCKTMESLSEYLELPKAGLAKAMVYRSTSGLVMGVVRGDHEVSIEKLNRIIDGTVIRLANSDELRSAGFVPGFLSPLAVERTIQVVVDDAVANTPNLIYGANEPDMHYVNGNFERDYTADLVSDISKVREGHHCPFCGKPLREQVAIELGNIFKLGDFYTKALDLSFQEESGTKVYPFMGSYGIGIGRLIAAVVETSHDEKGIIWPYELAPYKIFLMSIGKAPSLRRVVKEIHDQFADKVLLDDRHESISAKFKDADLLGMPLRFLISSRNYESGEIEVKERKTGNFYQVSRTKLAEWIDDYENGKIGNGI